MSEVREDERRLVGRRVRYDSDADFVGAAFEADGDHGEGEELGLTRFWEARLVGVVLGLGAAEAWRASYR